MHPIVPRVRVFAITLVLAAGLSTGAVAASGGDTNKAAGSDRSAEGCIGSAGYTWSQLRQECVRLFEAGVPLYNVEDPASTSVAYVVGGGATEPLELFLPDRSSGVLMFFRGGGWHDDDGRYSLTNTDNDVLELRDSDGKLIYTSRKSG